MNKSETKTEVYENVSLTLQFRYLTARVIIMVKVVSI